MRSKCVVENHCGLALPRAMHKMQTHMTPSVFCVLVLVHKKCSYW